MIDIARSGAFALLLTATAHAQGAVADEVLLPTLTSQEQFFDVYPSFGASIAVDDGRMFVGGPNWIQPFGGAQEGMVFHHVRAIDGTWPFVLRASGSGTQGFGRAVDVEGDTAVSSGYKGFTSGWIEFAVESPGNGWPTVATFDRAGVGASALFGASLDLDGDWTAVGAPGELRSATATAAT